MPVNDNAPIPAAEQLQFRRAEPVPAGPVPNVEQVFPPASAGTAACAACRQPIGDEYFHVQGRVVCPMCAARIQTRQQAPPHTSLARAALYGGGAALAGCALYAAVAILLHIEFGLIAIVVGIMVGKAIRHASKGLGGRPQQILAVALTYFAITTSYIPVFIYSYAQARHKIQQQHPADAQSPQPQTPPLTTPTPRPAPRPMSLARAIVFTFVLAMVAPFLILLHNPVSGLISLFIIFIGLQRAWVLTGRPEILVLGPYRRADSPAVAS